MTFRCDFRQFDRIPPGMRAKRLWALSVLGTGWILVSLLVLQAAIRLHQNLFLVFHLLWVLSLCCLFLGSPVRVKNRVVRSLAALGAVGATCLSLFLFRRAWLDSLLLEIGAWMVLTLAFVLASIAASWRAWSEALSVLFGRHQWIELWLAVVLASFGLWIRPLAMLFGDSLTACAVLLSVFLCGAFLGWALQTARLTRQSESWLDDVVPIVAALFGIVALNGIRFLGLSGSEAHLAVLWPLGSLSEFLIETGSVFILLLPCACAIGLVVTSFYNSPKDLREKTKLWRFPAIFLTVAGTVAILPKFELPASNVLLIILAFFCFAGASRSMLYKKTRREPFWQVYQIAGLILFLAWAWKVRHLEQDIELARLNVIYPGGRYMKMRDWPARLSVMEFPYGEKAVLREGLVEYGHGVEGSLIAALPFFLHGYAKKALLLGFGEGQAVSEAKQLGLDVEVVEPAMPMTWSRYFVSEEPRWHSSSWSRFLQQTSDHYDLVIADLPRQAGPPAFDALDSDFLTRVRRRLDPKGIAAFWVPMPAFETGFHRAAANFAAIFSHTAAWSYPNASGVLLLGSMEPLKPELLMEPSISDGTPAGLEKFLREQAGPQMKVWTEGWLTQEQSGRPPSVFSGSASDIPFIEWLRNGRLVVRASDLWNPTQEKAR